MSVRAGVDTGGTFTDLVLLDEQTGKIRMAKVLSTPKQPQQAVFDSFAKAGLETSEISAFVHGTTVATNALIERRGANVALLTTDGFRDILRIQRVTRPNHFDLHWVKPRHFVPRSRCVGIPERVLRDGEVLIPLDEDAVRAEVRRLRDSGEVAAIAVSYIFSFVNPDHELRTRELIHEEWPGVLVSLSHEVLPRWREYERTSTTVLDAYLKPLMHDYMARLEAQCDEGGIDQLFILRSNGGVQTPERAREQPVSLVRSGPSGGIMATAALGKSLGLGDLIACDMGGTSFEACLLPGSEPAFTNLEELEYGVPIALTMVDARAIGAGGGSLAWMDAAGILKVGPRSAGADPGPACYGRGGTQATTTDANVVLGRLAPEFLLAGDLKLDVEAAGRALDPLAEALGLSRERVAQGVVDVANSNMAQALRLVSTDRGYDPRGSTLVAYGGAGPLHACELARALQIGQVLIPLYPGAFSAFGALLADARFDYTRTAWMRMRSLDLGRINDLFAGMERRAVDDFAREGFAEAPKLVRSVEMRYVGQNWELAVSMPGGELTQADFDRAAKLFEEEHERFYGYSIPGEELELLTFNVAAVGTRQQVELPKLERGAAPEPVDRRPVIFDASVGAVETAIYHRDSFPAGAEIHGPAVVGQTDATTLIPPGAVARVDDHGNLLITV
ncbi:MAG: hydantoinase/oxoprolinase family protein [Thermoleophilia bacterium]